MIRALSCANDHISLSIAFISEMCFTKMSCWINICTVSPVRSWFLIVAEVPIHSKGIVLHKPISQKTSDLERPKSRDLWNNVKHRFTIEKIYNFRKRNEKWYALVKWRGHGMNKTSLIPVNEIYKYWDSNPIQYDPCNSVNASHRKDLALKKTHLSFLQKQTLKSIHSQIKKGI